MSSGPVHLEIFQGGVIPGPGSPPEIPDVNCPLTSEPPQTLLEVKSRIRSSSLPHQGHYTVSDGIREARETAPALAGMGYGPGEQRLTWAAGSVRS